MDNQDNVWINRQEYERLKALESETTKISIGSEPVLQPEPNVNKSSWNIILTVLMGISAVMSIFYPPIAIIFLILGFIGIVKLAMKRKTVFGKVSSSIGLGIVLLVAGGFIAFGPYVILIPIIIIYQLGCWTGLSTCQTA